MLEYPSLSCTIFGCIPCLSIIVACVCIASCSLMVFNPTRLAWVTHALLTVFGRSGCPSVSEVVQSLSYRTPAEVYSDTVENTCSKVVECVATNTVGMAGLSLNQAPILSY